MSVRVKICGITNVEDALAAIDAGADALGFVFCEASPRHVSVEGAADIIKRLPPFVARVGLFVNAGEEVIREVIKRCRIDTLQLHGDELPEECRKYHLPVIKAFRVRDESSLARLPLYEHEAWLLDSYVPGKYGGSGAIFNWDLGRRANQPGSRIILAGGLTPANVADAVRQVRPFAVDVSSGVESAPGKKDRRKLIDFIRSAKQTEPSL